MKKDLIFAPAMLLIGALLFLLRATGMTAHIVISVIGVLVLIAYELENPRTGNYYANILRYRVDYGHRDYECARSGGAFHHSQSKCRSVYGIDDRFADNEENKIRKVIAS